MTSGFVLTILYFFSLSLVFNYQGLFCEKNIKICSGMVDESCIERFRFQEKKDGLIKPKELIEFKIKQSERQTN